MNSGGERSGSSVGNGARKYIFWDFARGSWQYDLVVGLILLFIFAIPRDWFGDQPRAAKVVLISNTHGSQQLFLEPDLLQNVPEQGRAERAAQLVRQQTGKHLKVTRVEPIKDETDGELRG